MKSIYHIYIPSYQLSIFTRYYHSAILVELCYPRHLQFKYNENWTILLAFVRSNIVCAGSIGLIDSPLRLLLTMLYLLCSHLRMNNDWWHIYASVNWAIIDSRNGLSPVWDHFGSSVDGLSDTHQHWQAQKPARMSWDTKVNLGMRSMLQYGDYLSGYRNIHWRFACR